MKSAYERAMEKLEASSGPQRKLSDEQKARVSEIESTSQARIAEIKLSFDEKLAVAESPERESLQQQRASDLARIEEKCARDKEALWGESGD